MAVSVQRSEADLWSAALARAIASSVDILVEPISGQHFCESVRHPGVLYVITRDGRSCAAGANGQPCLHRAALLAQLGELPLPAPAACLWCNGCGSVPNDEQQRYDDCDACGGTGYRQDRRLAGQPAVEVVAAA